MFAQLYHAGALGSIRVKLHRKTATVAYKLLADGAEGVVITKRGDVKEYRVETVLRTLSFIGFDDVMVDLRGMDDDHAAA